MIKLLFFMVCIGSFSDIPTDTYSSLFVEYDFGYNLIEENDNIIGCELTFGYTPYINLESNLFNEYIVLEDKQLQRGQENITINSNNLEDYKLIRYIIQPAGAWLDYDEDYIYIDFDFEIYFTLDSLNSELDPIDNNISISTGYQVAYSGGYNYYSPFDLVNSYETVLTGNIYFDNSSPEYVAGYDDGYNAGVYDTSKEHALFKIFDAVFSVIDNVLQVEILPGIRLWYLLGVPLFFLILQFVLNLFR